MIGVIDIGIDLIYFDLLVLGKFVGGIKFKDVFNLQLFNSVVDFMVMMVGV